MKPVVRAVIGGIGVHQTRAAWSFIGAIRATVTGATHGRTLLEQRGAEVGVIDELELTAGCGPLLVTASSTRNVSDPGTVEDLGRSRVSSLGP